MKVPVLYLQGQLDTIKDDVHQAVADVIDSCRYIMGPEVTDLEAAVAAYSGAEFGIGVSSGAAVVIQDVPDHAFMAGVPAKQIGWATEGGERIPLEHNGTFECKTSGKSYNVTATAISEIDKTGPRR